MPPQGIVWAAHRRPAPIPNPAWQELGPEAQREAVQRVLDGYGLGARVCCTSVDSGARVTVRAQPEVSGAALLAVERTLKSLLDPTLYLEKTEQPDRNQLRLRGVEAL